MDSTPRLLNVTHDERGDVLIVHVTGEIDMSSAPMLECALRAACGKVGAPAGLVVLDLAGVQFMGAAGVHVLSAVRDDCQRAGIRLVLVAGAPVLVPLSLTQRDRGFEIAGTVDEAVHACQATMSGRPMIMRTVKPSSPRSRDT